MKNNFTAHTVTLMLLIITANTNESFGQILSYTNAPNGYLSSVAANATGTGLLRVNGAAVSGLPCNTGFSTSNFSSTTTYSSSLAAVEVSVTPNLGFSLNVTGFTADLNRSGSGPVSIRFAYSTNGGSTWAAQSSNLSSHSGPCGKTYTLLWAISVSVNAPATLKFRIYGFNANKTSGTEQILNLKIIGTVSSSGSSCGVASGLSAINITSSSATLDWNDVSGATGYNIRYRKTGTSTWSNATSATSSVAVSGLASSTTYEFQVQTVCSGGTTSAFSSSATFTTTAPACGVTSGLSAINITSSSATLDWNDVSGATGYNIRYRKTGTSTWTSTGTTSATSSVAVSGLASSTTYEFRVQTVCSGGTTSAFSLSATFTTLGSGASGVPAPDHVVILILENHAYSQIIGSSAAPHINALANDASSALFTQSFAIEHPSQPNYLDLFSGSNQGVTDDNIPAGIPFTTPNLGRELINASRFFTTFSEDLPSVGYNGATSGAYARKHNPAANWMGTGTNQIPATTNQPFTAFPSSTNYASLPTVCYVVPNQNNDMHNGSDPSRITTADNWMYNNLNSYIQWAKTHNSLFILTFDEDNGSQGNRIVTIFTGSMVAAGQYSNHIDHYSILRTIEDMYGLPYAGNASSPITNCWKSTAIAARPATIASSNGVDNKVTVYPNPATSLINFSLHKLPSSPVLIRIFDIAGRLEREYQLLRTKNLQVNIASLPAGNYYYNMIQNNQVLYSGIFMVAGKPVTTEK